MPLRAEDCKTVKDLILKEDGFLLTGHERPDGDVTGSELALFHAFKALGKRVWAANGFPVTPEYDFLPGIEHVTVDPPPWPVRAVFYCDASDLTRVAPALQPALKSAPYLVSVDHHLGNEIKTPYRLIDVNAASTGMVIHRFLEWAGWPVTKDIATAVYTTLVTDTGNFKQANTSSEALNLAASIVEKHGVSPHAVYSSIFERNRIQKIRLMSRIFGEAREAAGGKILWSEIPRKLLTDLCATDDDLEGLIDFGKSVGTVRAVVFFRETAPGQIKVNLRSKPGVDVLKICKLFGGGGHRLAAGCTVPGEISEVRKKVLGELEKAVL